MKLPPALTFQIFLISYAFFSTLSGRQGKAHNDRYK